MNTRKIDTGLLVVAMLAGLANYEGLSLAIRADSFWQHAFCAAIALGVYTSISVFWHVVFHVAPQMQDARLRIGTWVTTGFGMLAILGMSAWFSVAALGGPSAMQAGYDAVVAQAEQAVAAARAQGGKFQVLVPGLEALNSDLGGMTKCERGGCLTAGAGTGGITALLAQLRDKASALLAAAKGSQTTLDAMSNKANGCLAAMRAALATSSIREREDALARQVDCFNGALADVGNVGGGAGIAQALDSFTSGVVIPVTVKTDKQKDAAAKILSGLKERTAALAQSARGTVSTEPFVAVAMARPNAMQAIVEHWTAVLPAWVTGICLDLAPLALLLLATLKASHDRQGPDLTFLDRPIKDIISVRRALAEIEPPAAPQLPQRRPGPKGMTA